MPEFLGGAAKPQQTGDAYTPALTLGPAPNVKRVTLSNIGSAPALIQCWRYLDKSRTKVELEAVERVIVGQSIGVSLTQCAGFQVRSYIVGTPTQVVGELIYDNDVELDGGAVTAAVLDASGNVIG